MTDKEIYKFGEIQYLKGRLDELQKALPNVTSLDGSRRLDQRMEKYYNKLKRIDPVAYHLYIVEQNNRTHSKEKSKKDMMNLFEEIIRSSNIKEPELLNRVQEQINKYKD